MNMNMFFDNRQRRERYVSPETEMIILESEISFLLSGENNERTTEEDLF